MAFLLAHINSILPTLFCSWISINSDDMLALELSKTLWLISNVRRGFTDRSSGMVIMILLRN